MKTRQYAIIICSTCLAYCLLFIFNEFIFGSLGFSTATHWIYLPSGLRLVFVLLFGFLGAIGVAFGSVALAYIFYFPNDPVSAIGAGIISGLAPYISRIFCHAHLGLDLDLKNLSASRLVTVALFFSVLSATLHQILFVWRGYTDNFLTATAVMSFGDFTGSIMMLYCAKLVLSKLKQF